MSLQPRIRRVLVPPASIPTKTASPIAQLDAACSLATHQAKATTRSATAPTSSSSFATSTAVIQRHITQHTVLPLVAYVLEQSSNNNNTGSSNTSATTSGMGNNSKQQHPNQVLVVQNFQTQEIVWSLHWHDVAALLLRTGGSSSSGSEPPPSSLLPGTIVALQFYDASVLHWSRLSVAHKRHASNHHHGNSEGLSTTAAVTNAGLSPPLLQPHDDTERRSFSLVVQTDKRILLLNLKRGALAQQTLFSDTPTGHLLSSSLLQANLSDKTVGSTPSSNALPVVNARWLLVGCADGSLKCFDWISGSIFKKIKGLGKGDCVTYLLAAHPYHDPSATHAVPTSTTPSTAATTTTTTTRRILTVTKKGLVYLMELTMDAQGTNMDLQPPLARFQIPSDATSTDVMTANEANMEDATYTYDAHMDRFFWFAMSSKGPVVYVWNLKPFSNTSSSAVKSLLKPEPTLIVHFPAVSSVAINHPLGLSSPNKDDRESMLSSAMSAGSSSINLGLSSTANSAVPAAAVMTAVSSSQVSVATVVTGLAHAAFSEDTVVSVTVTASGDLCLHGAEALAANTTSSVQATPCMSIHLKQALIAAIPSLQQDSENSVSLVEQAELKVHAVTTRPLQATGLGTILTVATNWGIVVLELPVYSNATVRARSVISASRYLHFGAGLGSLGKSTLTAQNSTVTYGSLDVLTINPVGWLEAKNPVRLYDSPAASHMPPEFYKRPFRCAPLFLQSPSGTYVCLFWPCEFRYEILHAASLLQQIGQVRPLSNTNTGGTTPQGRNPVVASGTGVCDFGWVSDDDVFAILHAPDLQEQAALQVPKQSDESESYNLMSPNLKLIGAGAMGVANLATSVTKTATNATLSATKLATSAAVNTTMTVTKGATTAANLTVGVTTKAIRSGAKGVTKGVKKSFGIFTKKKKIETEGSIVTAADDDDDEDEESTTAAKSAAVLALQQGLSAADLEALRTPKKNSPALKQRYVELKRLEGIDTQNAELSSGIPMATCLPLGQLTLRGGNRTVPTVIFGGPVLCVATRSEDDKEGHAHFYTSKSSGTESNAAPSYQSSGPTLPFLDIVAWDDDGRLCAIVVENRIAIYLSDEQMFELLGSVRIGSPSTPTAEITSIKFLHNALFCCTWNSIHCVLLGDLERGICLFDTFLLASTDAPVSDRNVSSLSPVPVLLPLVQPTILGYHSGSLIVSTLRGVQAIPLQSPLMRIGLLLSAGQTDRAMKWLDGIPNSDHGTVAAFLERRGYPEMALQLPGLSLETIVDLSMKYGYIDRLEDVVETFGVSGFRSIDMGRGVSSSIFGSEHNGHSVLVCVGAYLLAHGRVELTRRLATECLRSEGGGKKDAFFLGTLLLSLDQADATRLLQRAVRSDDDSGGRGGMTDDWLVGKYVRDFVLAPGSALEQT